MATTRTLETNWGYVNLTRWVGPADLKDRRCLQIDDIRLTPEDAVYLSLELLEYLDSLDLLESEIETKGSPLCELQAKAREVLGLHRDRSSEVVGPDRHAAFRKRALRQGVMVVKDGDSVVVVSFKNRKAQHVAVIPGPTAPIVGCRVLTELAELE